MPSSAAVVVLQLTSYTAFSLELESLRLSDVFHPAYVRPSLDSRAISPPTFLQSPLSSSTWHVVFRILGSTRDSVVHFRSHHCRNRTLGTLRGRSGRDID